MESFAFVVRPPREVAGQVWAGEGEVERLLACRSRRSPRGTRVQVLCDFGVTCRASHGGRRAFGDLNVFDGNLARDVPSASVTQVMVVAVDFRLCA
jgi:hypothetical protein